MRRWLRAEDKSDYDDMWLHAEDLADAAGEANPRDPMRGVLMSICLGQQMEINRLEARLDELDTD